MMKEKIAGVAVLVMACTLVATTASAEARGSFDRTLQVSGPVDLDIRSGSGSITVRTGSSDVVKVHGEIRSQSWDGERKVRYLEENPPIEQNGNSIRIGRADDRDMMNNVSIRYELEVPVETSLVSKTGSGSQTIGNIAGPAEVSSGSGSLGIGDIGGDVEATAGSGSIEIGSAKGRVRAKTGSGSIRAFGVSGPITSSSGSGSVEFEQTGPGDVDIETGSGSVRVRGVRGALSVETGSGSIQADGEMTGRWYLRSSSGSVTVRLPSGAAFDLNARTSSGDIESDHPVTVHEMRKKEIRGKVGDGGYTLEIRTSSGDIRIK
jgi:DUF4097 and DUF4098 domain-containing protein YvlB